MFSERTAHEGGLNPLARALETRRREGRPVFDLTVSNPTVAGLPYARDAILTALTKPRGLTYAPEPFGELEARLAVARELAQLGVTVDPRDIALTASTSEAYACLLKLLCDPEDELLVPRPSYPLFDWLATFESVRCVPYRLAYDGRWFVDLDSVRRAITPRTRAIALVSPNNPTGSFVSQDELRALASFGLPLISDEVFASYPLDPSSRAARTALSASPALVFALGGLSKLAALPQMKVAWIAMRGPDARLAEARRRLELILDTYLSVSTPSQLALADWLALRDVTERAIAARVRQNLDRVESRVRATAVSQLHAEGGWYTILRLPRTLREEDWALAFLEHDGVYVHPGAFFGFEDEAYVVISLLTPPDELDRGVSLLVERVAHSG